MTDQAIRIGGAGLRELLEAVAMARETDAEAKRDHRYKGPLFAEHDRLLISRISGAG
jgi:hypothetical protein